MNQVNIFRILFLLTLPLAFFTSCESDDQFGLDMQPPGDLLNATKTDTISIVAYTVTEDSIRTDETSQSLAGYYFDPVFGPLRASFCSQLRLSGTDVDFGDNATVDSVVLHLEYYSMYGNPRENNRMTFSVYELDQSIELDTVYYSDEPIIAGRKLGSKNFIPNLRDSMVVGGRTLAPQLRIRLDKDLGKDFIEAASMGLLSDNSTFESFFHGFCVIPETNGSLTNGSVLSLDVLSANSGLTIYYHNDEDTLSYKFNITLGCARYSRFEHFGFTGADPQFLSQINGDTALGQQKLYIQPMGGTKVVMKFPYLSSLNNGFSIVINKAELILPVDESDLTAETWARPVSLSLVQIRDDSTYAFLPDQTLSEETFGGTYDSDIGGYRFVLTRHIQNLITGGVTDRGLALMVSGASVRANRVILNGPGSSNPMRLEITYTLIN